MKSSKNFKYVSKFKYFMLIPIVLVLVSIIIGAIFNLNYDYDFRKVDNFSVKFNTTITETEYDFFESNIKSILDNADFDDYRLERIGSGAQNGILVRIPNDDSQLDSKIEDLKVNIEENLLADSSSIESSVVITTTDTEYSLPKNVTKLFWLAVLSVFCILVFVFFYNWIRFNLVSGYTIVLSILLEIVTLLATMITFRIPFNYYFVVPFVVMIISTIINSTIINNYIKSTLNNESYNRTTNANRVQEASLKTLKTISIYNIMLSVIIFAVMFFGGASLIYLGLAILLGLVVSMFVSLIINTSLWSFWYKKDKDGVLKRRVEAEKHREEIKSGKKVDDKIVV